MNRRRLLLDAPALLFLLLLLATLGQGWPSSERVGLPLPWKIRAAATLAIPLVLLLWAMLSRACFKTWPSVKSLAERPVATFLFFIVLTLLAKWPYLPLPYFWDAMGYVVSGAWETLESDFPLVLGPVFDSGHPPLFYLLLAGAWKLFGATQPVAHLFNLAWGALALYGTYLLGRRLYGAAVGFSAALLLFFAPLFYAQIGTLHFEPSLAALTVLGVYFVLTRRLVAWWACAAAMVLIKEPSVVLIPAVALSVLIVEWRQGGANGTVRRAPAADANVGTARRAPARAVGQAVLYALPALVLPLWLAYHYMITEQRYGAGWLLTPPGVPKEVKLYGPQLYAPLLCIFKEQYRWTLSLCTAGAAFLWWDRNRQEGRGRAALFGWLRTDSAGLPLILAVGFVGYAIPTGLVFFSPRYLLPLLPLFFVPAAAGLHAFLGGRAPLGIALVLLLLGGAAQHPPEREDDLGGSLRYTSYLRAHRVAGHYLAEHDADARILANYPLDREYSSPIYGFVPKALTLVSPTEAANPAAWDYWAFTEDSAYNDADFPGWPQLQERYPMAARFVDNVTRPRLPEPEVRIYASPHGTLRNFVDLAVLSDGTVVRTTRGGSVLVEGRRLTGLPRLTAGVVDTAWNAAGTGVWLLLADGSVVAWGQATAQGGLVEPASGVVRALAAWPDGEGYAVLDRTGAVQGFGSAREVHYPGEADRGEAYDLFISPEGAVYVLYGSGYIARFGAPDGPGVDFGQDTARVFAPSPTGSGWYILDSYGGVHTTPDVPVETVRKPNYYNPESGAADLTFGPGGKGYLMDHHGAIYPF